MSVCKKIDVNDIHPISKPHSFHKIVSRPQNLHLSGLYCFSHDKKLKNMRCWLVYCMLVTRSRQMDKDIINLYGFIYLWFVVMNKSLFSKPFSKTNNQWKRLGTILWEKNHAKLFWVQWFSKGFFTQFFKYCSSFRGHVLRVISASPAYRNSKFPQKNKKCALYKTFVRLTSNRGRALWARNYFISLLLTDSHQRDD